MLQVGVYLCTLCVLMVITFQDFKFRAVSWFAFPLLFILLWFGNSRFELLSLGFNLGFIALNFLLLLVFFSLKQRKLVNLFGEYIGAGDLLMLLCLAVWFPFLNFFAFYFISLLLVTAGAGLYIFFQRPTKFTVPLAGLQSGMLLFLVIVNWSAGMEINTSLWLENYLP